MRDPRDSNAKHLRAIGGNDDDAGRQPTARAGSFHDWSAALLSDQDREDAVRLLKILAQSLSEERLRRSADDSDRELAKKAARWELASRQARSRFFNRSMFGEPAWEMLLQLYVEQTGRRFTTVSLAAALSVPIATAVRWLEYLEGQRLVYRTPHPTDMRSAYIELTETGLKNLEEYLSETLMGAP